MFVVKTGMTCEKFVSESAVALAKMTCALAAPEWATLVVITLFDAGPPTRQAGAKGSSKPPFTRMFGPTPGVPP